MSYILIVPTTNVHHLLLNIFSSRCIPIQLGQNSETVAFSQLVQFALLASKPVPASEMKPPKHVAKTPNKTSLNQVGSYVYTVCINIYMLNICYVFISPTSIDFFKCKVQATDSTSSQRLWHAITSEMGATGPRPHSGKNVPMDPHGDSAGVWTLCTPASSSIKFQAAAAKTSPLLCCCCRDSCSSLQLQSDQKPKRILQRNDMAIPGWFAEAVPYGGMSPSVGKGKGWRRLASNSTDLTQCLPPTAEPSFSNSTSIYNNILIICRYIETYALHCITIITSSWELLGHFGSCWIRSHQRSHSVEVSSKR